MNLWPRIREMPDTFDSGTRSKIMARVKGWDTAPELVVRKALFAAGYRFRLHRKDLPGKPDIVLPRRRLAVFVNGCFWHGHPCKRGGRIPSTNREYWMAKVARNVERDRLVHDELEASGWRWTVIWECSLEADLQRLLTMLRAETRDPES